MEYINLGRSGLKVSRLCLGMMSFGSTKWREWILDEEAAKPFIKRALEAGIIFFDTADVYSLGESERILGRLLKFFSVKRDQVVIATKVYHPMSEDVNDQGLSRKHILDSIDRSLKNLGTDYIDLYQIHRWDYNTSIEETLDVLNDLVRAGKVRYLGASSMYAWQFAKALFAADLDGWERFISMQNHYNLIYREEEREMIPLCVDQGIGLLPWSPQARGFFAGNHRKEGWGDTIRARSDGYGQSMYYRDEDFTVADRVLEIAGQKGVSGSQLALAWVLSKSYITSPIIGATKLDHLEQSLAALNIRLTEDEIRKLEEPYQVHPVLGHT